jgi:hypothetical protein
MSNDNDLQRLAIKHGLLDSLIAIAARNAFEKALIDLADNKRVYAGISEEGFDFWVKLNGIEYFVTIKPSGMNGEAA